jgi:hypothetical protein
MVHRGAELATGFVRFSSDGFEFRLGLAPLAIDFGLSGADQSFGIDVWVERRFELGELADQFLKVLLVDVGLFEFTEPNRPNFSKMLGGPSGALFGDTELLSGLLRFDTEPFRTSFRFGLPDYLGQPFQRWSHR